MVNNREHIAGNESFTHTEKFKKMRKSQPCTRCYKEFYYIDTSVLLESIPLVNFIKTTSGTRVVYFP